MKNKFYNLFAILTISALLLLTGCGIPSVHPLYNQEDLINNEFFTGTWENENGNSRYAVMSVEDLQRKLEEDPAERVLPSASVANDDGDSGGETALDEITDGLLTELVEMDLGKIYLVQQMEQPENIYLAGLIELDNGYYLDFSKIDTGSDPFMFPVHIFMKITLDEDELKFHMFSESWLKELISNRQIRISHEMTIFEQFLLTAQTDELQKFVVKYGDMDEAIGNTDTYRKISPVSDFVFEEQEEE